MRVPKQWVPVLTKKIIDSLLQKELVNLTVPAKRLLADAEQIILEELMMEDRVNEEVRKILKQHESEIEKGRLDYKRLFDMTKQKILKERNIVL